MSYSVLPAYGLVEPSLTMEVFGSGLINRTWKITDRDQAYILQRVNDVVFDQPQDIAHNIHAVAAYLKQHAPAYPFVAPIPAAEGSEMIFVENEGFFRLFPFVSGSRSHDVVTTPEQAYEAALQFGRFSRLLSGLSVDQLKTTIPGFHDLGLRYQQFLRALEAGNPIRREACSGLIDTLLAFQDIVAEYGAIGSHPEFRLRATHHDTKISNVLFDQEGKGLCVVDLDTVMPGYFISDVGDMMRTYLSPVSEEESDYSKIEVRADFYKAIVQGYYSEMKDELTDTEKQYFFYSGKFMIYMQALRFLTDHLNNDSYYGARYEGHNLVRAQNQAVLLQRLIVKEPELAGLAL